MKASITAIATTLLLSLTSVAVWAQSSEKGAEGGKENSSPVASAPQEASSVASASYVIGPEDTVHVSVWKEPDLTSTLPVRPDGMISLPLLNDVQAAGLTPMELAASVTAKLKKYLADPRVTVVVTTINSKRVYVTGEVLHGGAVTLMPNMT